MQYDKILFGHFVTTLNAAFGSKLVLEDEGYESGSENFNIPTPLRRTSKIQHISCVENASLIQYSYTTQHMYQTVTSQTCMMMFNLQFFQRWRHPYGWYSFACQYNNFLQIWQSYAVLA